MSDATPGRQVGTALGARPLDGPSNAHATLRLISSHELTAHLIQVIRTHLASIDDAFVARCPMSTRFGSLAILAQGADPPALVA